ncbi:Subtilisin-like protease [Morus notabilis]|uniref:Subtilisin-like protease n=1 Tax=Morus notabilis TaxID=981085 RepID=W9QVN2_9ROSA|nr:Subtilisin-like protease [Morus notabilis]
MSILLLLFLCLSLPYALICGLSSPNQIPKHYVIYMGATNPSSNEINGDIAQAAAAELAHLQLLSTIIPSQESERISIIHNYKHAFRGFSAMLTEDEAHLLSDHSDVISVFPDTMLQLHTTRSWDFIEGKAGRLSRWGLEKHVTSDIIIGILDTGIWPESPSFNDEGIGPIPSRWKGVCLEGSDFKKSNCNRKLIGARYYANEEKTLDSPRDSEGHGTHVASTAAGAPVTNASYFGLARGTARGGAPSARIASYKVCSSEGCYGAAILQGIDDAVNDGVDVISISIGSGTSSEFFEDPIAIGAFHADQNGVVVVCSAGNYGPEPFTVGNTAPWIFTVAASSLDRDFQSTVLLGNGRGLKGSAIFLKLSRSAIHPLVFGKDAAPNSSVALEASKCYPGSLDPKKLAGKIVVCADDEEPLSLRGWKRQPLVEEAKVKGVIFIEKEEGVVPSVTGIFPYVEVGKIAGSQILNYIKSTKKPTATILPTVEISRHKPAPIVAYFSSRGPGELTENILKPDIMAPGVNILAAMVPKIKEAVGKKLSKFSMRSGTSMSCPHVSGAAAFVKSVRRRWTSSMIKSALMTTAKTYDNRRKVLTNSSSHIANPHEAGSGEMNPIKALNPGLVFETTTQDYLQFLCYYGYSQKDIRSVASNTKFKCPEHSNKELISNINYPSISISKLRRNQSKVIQRTVTNVGPSNSAYIAKVQSPKGLVVKVIPDKIVFTKGLKRAPFEVSFFGNKEAASGYNYGSITWFDDRRSVRVVFTVNLD